MADGLRRGHRSSFALVVAAAVVAHALALRTLWPMAALPAAVLIIAAVVDAKHLGLVALVRRRWRRGERRRPTRQRPVSGWCSVVPDRVRKGTRCESIGGSVAARPSLVGCPCVRRAKAAP